MKLEEALSLLPSFSPPAVPELRYIKTAVQKVHDRWPSGSPPPEPRERESFAVRLRDRVNQNDWNDVRLSFVLAAAVAVFDAERRDRLDLEDARNFLVAEIFVSRSETFLSGMLAVYLDSFVEKSRHTRALSRALAAAREQMNASSQRLLQEVPELLDAEEGPGKLADRIRTMADPFIELLQAGLRNPHGPGFMERTHDALSHLLRSELTTRARIDWYIDWLRPPGRTARTSGAERAIEALTYPWLEASPSDQLQSHLVEALIEMYGDPRIRSGGVWAGVDPASIQVIHRWLTREDMRFFTGVVDAAQKDAMWVPRRDFWLQLFDEKRIDAAWVAFSSEATDYAQAHLMRQDARNVDSRFGFQRARHNTSLLIMRIGNKVFVDGCHSYKTHVFAQDDPMAPKLFQEGYDCDEIKEASPQSKPHNSIDSWKRWVRDMINADVGRSTQTEPYSRVFRPRKPSLRNLPTPRRDYNLGSRTERHIQTQLDMEPSKPAEAWPKASADTARVPSQINAKIPANPANSSVETRTAPGQSLLDRLILIGPPAAKAFLDHFDQGRDERMKKLLSPNARAGLIWITEKKSPLPDTLRNALAHLLVSMATYGHSPTGIINRAGSLSDAQPADQAALPRLPETAESRLELLRRHAEAMEVYAGKREGLSTDRTIGVALGKLKGRSQELRPAEIDKLQRLYELMRINASRGRT